MPGPNRYMTRRDGQELVQSLAQRDALRDVKLQESAMEAQSVSRQNRLQESQRMLQLALSNSGLPPRAQTIIAESFDSRVFQDSELLDAIERQRRLCESYAQSFAPAVVQTAQKLVAQQQASHGFNSFDQFKCEIDRCFGFDPKQALQEGQLSESEFDVYNSLPKQTSLRRAFSRLYDDDDCRLSTLGQYSILREANSTDLPYALGDSMYRAVLQRYNDQAPLWREFCEVVPVSNFKEQKRILVGGLGILPRVAESDTAFNYLTLGFPRDEQRVYNVGTFGGLIIVTRQMIINDEFQVVQRYPLEAASAAVMTLNLNVFRALMGNAGGGGINTDLSYTGLNMYHVGHNNLLTAGGISYANLITTLQKLAEQRRFANVFPLLVAALIATNTFTVTLRNSTFLKVGDDVVVYGGSGGFVTEQKTVTAVNTGTGVVTVDSNFGSGHTLGARVEQLGPPIAYSDVKIVHSNLKKGDVFSLMASSLIPGSANNDASALYPDYQTGRVKPYPLHTMYMGGAVNFNNFFASCGRPIECGFLGGKEEPELLLQDNPLVDKVFSGDQISWKMRHEHGQVLTDHRPIAAGIF